MNIPALHVLPDPTAPAATAIAEPPATPPSPTAVPAARLTVPAVSGSSVTNLAEQAVLGGILLAPTRLEPLLVEERLEARHFQHPDHRDIYQAMVELHDRDARIDDLTVIEHLQRTSRLDRIGGRVTVDALASAAPVAANVRDYARIVVEHATWRARLTVAQTMAQAAVDRDDPAWTAAEADLHRTDSDTGIGDADPDQLAHEAFDRLADQQPADVIALPWPILNRAVAGGLRRGHCTVLAAWTGQGKSWTCLQLLAHAAQQTHPSTNQPLQVRLYANEMSRDECVDRMLAQLTGISFTRIQERTLDAQQRKTLLDRLAQGLPFGITECHGWDADRIARHIRRHKWDLAAVDLLTRIPQRDVADVDHISRTLNIAALQADAHLILVSQLNQERAKQEIRPRPVLRDLRGSGSLGNDAANVLFLHREQERVAAADGSLTDLIETLPEGQMYFDKVRNGRTGGCQVFFTGARGIFEQEPRP